MTAEIDKIFTCLKGLAHHKVQDLSGSNNAVSLRIKKWPDNVMILFFIQYFSNISTGVNI